MSVGRFRTVDPIEDCSFGATISVTMASIGSVISCVSAVRGGIGSMIATLERPEVGASPAIGRDMTDRTLGARPFNLRQCGPTPRTGSMRSHT